MHPRQQRRVRCADGVEVAAEEISRVTHELHHGARRARVPAQRVQNLCRQLSALGVVLHKRHWLLLRVNERNERFQAVAWRTTGRRLDGGLVESKRKRGGGEGEVGVQRSRHVSANARQLQRRVAAKQHTDNRHRHEHERRHTNTDTDTNTNTKTRESTKAQTSFASTTSHRPRIRNATPRWR